MTTLLVHDIIVSKENNKSECESLECEFDDVVELFSNNNSARWQYRHFEKRKTCMQFQIAEIQS